MTDKNWRETRERERERERERAQILVQNECVFGRCSSSMARDENCTSEGR